MVKPWLLLLPGLLLLGSGCHKIPKKDSSTHFSYFSLPAPEKSGEKAIESIYLDQAERAPSEHHVLLLNIGEAALLARIHLIRSATESIDIQTFIWKEDEVTQVIFQEIEQAAQRGVHVRILVDALNPISGNTRLAEMAVTHPSLEIAVFRPLSEYTQPLTLNKLESLILKMRRLNRRMHNKLLLIDDKVGVVGGRNYENNYFDRSSTMIFKDTDVLVTGPSVVEMNYMFEAYWEHEDSVYLTQFKDVQARLPLPPDTKLIHSPPQEIKEIQQLVKHADAYDLKTSHRYLKFMNVQHAEFYWDPPEKFHWGQKNRSDLFLEAMKEAVYSAEDRVLFQTPYLIYQRGSYKNLKRLRKKNPDLNVWVSSNSLAAADHEVVYGVSYKNRKQLYKKMELEIFEFSPYPKDLLSMVPSYPEFVKVPVAEIQKALVHPLFLSMFAHGHKLTLHSKIFVVDDQIAQIGSHNFDPRSSKLNTECGLLVYDQDFARILRDQILNDMTHGNSWVVGKRNESENLISHMSGFMGGISNLLPLFDIWPYPYTSNFVLKPGYEPLPSSRHPDFHQHYEDVGQFPMVHDVFGIIKARLMKAFGGWTRPFM